MSRSRAMRSARPRAQDSARQLQRHLTLQRSVGALSQPHRTHATDTEFAQQPIGSDQRTGL